MAAVVLLLVSYVGGAPFIAFIGQRHFPAAEPFFAALDAPLVYVARDPDAPGHAAFVAYLDWTQSLIHQALE